MNRIKIEHNPSDTRLMELEVPRWPIWSKEVSVFPWTYDDPEYCYLVEGEAIITPDGGEPVKITKGDFVSFPAGMSCTWDIRQAITKHYSFSYYSASS